jgi:hypothetical protein
MPVSVPVIRLLYLRRRYGRFATRWLASCAFLLSSFATPALAQSNTVVVSGSELGVMTPTQAEARIAELERAYNSVNLAGPRAGVGVSAILVPGAAFMIAAGAARRSIETTFFCPPENRRCGDPTAGSAALIGVGAAVLLGGIVGTALSSQRLSARKKERRRIQWEIDRVKRSLP